MVRRQDFSNAFDGEASRGCEHAQCYGNRSDWFSFAVAVRVGFVGRSGRHGQAWTWDGPVNLKNARFAEDESPLDPTGTVSASRDYSRAATLEIRLIDVLA